MQVSDFQVLQLKSELEFALENMGSQHKESLKLLLQYSKLLGQYADQLDQQKAIQILSQAYKILLPELSLNILTQQYQYWRLLLVTAIKLSKALEINGQLQEGLNILCQVENYCKPFQESILWSQNVELEYLYFHLAIYYKKMNDREKSFFSANECILLLKNNIKKKSSRKEIYMLSEMLELQSLTKLHKYQKIEYYNQIYYYQKKYLGETNKETIKTIMKINQLQIDIQFENEIEHFSNTLEFENNRNSFQENQYEEEKSFIIDQLNLQQIPNNKQQPATFDHRLFLKQKLIGNNDVDSQKQNKSILKRKKQSQEIKKSADDLSKFVDIKLNTKANSGTQNTVDNQFYYFLHPQKIKARTKTDTTQIRTTTSKLPDRSTPHKIRMKTNKSNITLNNSNIQQIITDQVQQQNKNNSVEYKYKDLLLKRPKSTQGYQRITKQLQMMTNKNHSNKIQDNPKNIEQCQNQQQFKQKDRIIKRLNTKDFSLKKQNKSNQNVQTHVSELTTKKSNQQQDIILYQPSSQKSFIELEEKCSKPSNLDQIEQYNNNKLISIQDAVTIIQRFFRKKIAEFKYLQLKMQQVIVDEIDKRDKTPSISKRKVRDLKNNLFRSNTTSLDSNKPFTIMLQKYREQKQPISIHSQGSSKLMIVKSSDDSEIREQSQESNFDIEQFYYQNRNKWLVNETLQAKCIFFCSQQQNLPLKLLRFFVALQDLKDNEVKVSFYVYIQRLSKTHLVKFNSYFSLEALKNIYKQEGMQLFNSLLTKFININNYTSKYSSFTAIYIGKYYDQQISDIINNFSIIMSKLFYKITCNGTQLVLSQYQKQLLNRQLISELYLKQRQEQKQYFFKQKDLYLENYKVILNFQEQETINNSMKSSDNDQNNFQNHDNEIKFAININKSGESLSPQQLAPIPLMQLEDSELNSPQLLDISYRDPDINRVQLKKIINFEKKRDSLKDPDISRYSKLFSNNQIKYHQRNKSNQTPTKQAGSSIFKKAFTVDTHNSLNQIQKQEIVETINLLPQDFEQISNNDLNKNNNESKSEISKQVSIKSFNDQEPNPPQSVSQSINSNPFGLNVFAKKYNQQFQTTSLLDTQTLLIGEQLFDTQALEILELQPDYDDQDIEIAKRVVTLYQANDYFIVSPKQKITNKIKKKIFDQEYFQNQQKLVKLSYQKIYNNPFCQQEVLNKGIIKIEKQFISITVTQILSKPLEYFNQAMLNNKDAISIIISFRLVYPFGIFWEDNIKLKFKEFTRWFIPNFELSKYVKNFGLSSVQKISSLQDIYKFAQIKDSKAKFQYFTKKCKQKQKQFRRRDIELQRMILIETLLIRNHIDFDKINDFQLKFLYLEMKEERNKGEKRKQQKEQQYKKYLQIQDYNKNEISIQIPIDIGIDQEPDFEERTISAPNSLNNVLLKNYNTIIYLQKQKQILKINNSHLILNSYSLKIWNPFIKKVWKQVLITTKNREKLINAFQSNYQNYLLKHILQNTLTLNGMKLTINFNNNFKVLTQQQTILSQYFKKQQFTNQEFYNFLSCLKYQLLQSDQSFWNTYFIQNRRLQRTKIHSLGECILESVIFIDNFSKTILQQFDGYILFRINIFQINNMKTKMFKLCFTLQDLEMALKRVYKSQDIELMHQDIQKLMQKFIFYEKNYGIRKEPNLLLKNQKTNENINLSNRFYWNENFNYDDFKITLYPQLFRFYQTSLIKPTIILSLIKYITFPSIFQKRQSGYQQNQMTSSRRSLNLQLGQIRLPCIIQIEKIKEVECYNINLYFPYNSRKFMTKLDYNQINKSQINNNFVNELMNDSQKAWEEIIDQFWFSINDQKKLLLNIKTFQISCILQEVLCKKIKFIPRTKESILFIISIIKRFDLNPDTLTINYPFERITISEANNYNIFLKLQWLNYRQKIQSFKLPLYELMLGYYQKHIKNQKKIKIFDYKFKLIDIIQMLEIVLENIIINFQENTQFTYVHTLDELIPQINSKNQRIKLNLSLKTIKVEKSKYLLLYRGVLMKNPQIIVAIYQKLHSQKLHFFIQRISDGEFFIYKLSYLEVENIYPGFKLNLKINQRAIGLNIFKVVKNRLIIQCHYQLS